MEKVENAIIVELNYEHDLQYMDLYNTVESGIKFYYNEMPTYRNLEEDIKFITDFYKVTGKKFNGKVDLSDTQAVLKELVLSYENEKKLQYILEEYSEYYLSEDDKSYSNFTEIFDDNLCYELLDEISYNFDDKDIYQRLADLTNFRLQKMYGWAQGDWGYGLMSDDVPSDYAEDLYRGSNWYWVKVNFAKGGEDTLGGLYIKNKEDLEEILSEYFGIDVQKEKYYLVKNNESMYDFDDVDKVNKYIASYEYYEVN